MAEHIATYAAFFDFYLREHARPATRALHYAGTVLGTALLLFALATQRWWLVPVAVLCGYAFAWIAHLAVEKNRPATFSYPLWSLISDYRMLWLFATARLDAALVKAGVKG